MVSTGTQASEQEPGARAGFRALLTDRVFAPFFYANALSNTGNWFQNVAAGILVFDLTGSSTAVAVVSILQFATSMVLTPWAGTLSDRVDRRWLLFTGQSIALVGATGLAVYVLSVGVEDLSGPLPVYLATAVLGVGIGVILPSLQALVPALVERRDLDRAITLNSMTFNLARGIGPVVAGAVVAAFGAGVAFGVNAVTFLPLLVVLALIDLRGPTAPDSDPGDAGDGVGGDGDDGTVRETVRWILAHPAVVALLLATLAVGWTSDPFTTLVPALADDLGEGEAAVGYVLGAFGGGAALVAPASNRIRAAVGRGPVTGLGLCIVGAGLAVVAVAPGLAVALVGSAVAGVGFLLGVTSTNTELQRGIPDERRGRVMAFWSVAFLGCRPLAATLHGRIADLVSVRAAFLVVAVIAVAAGLAVWRSRPTGEQVAEEVSASLDG